MRHHSAQGRTAADGLEADRGLPAREASVRARAPSIRISFHRETGSLLPFRIAMAEGRRVSPALFR